MIGSRPPQQPEIWRTGPRREHVRRTAACLHLLCSVRRKSILSRELPVIASSECRSAEKGIECVCVRASRHLRLCSRSSQPSTFGERSAGQRRPDGRFGFEREGVSAVRLLIWPLHKSKPVLFLHITELSASACARVAKLLLESTRLMRVAIAAVIVNSLTSIVTRVDRDLRVA